MTTQDYQNGYLNGKLPSQLASGNQGASNQNSGNFLGNLLSSLANPFIQSAKNIGGAAYEIPREIGLLANEGNVNNDNKRMQATGDALKANPTAANMRATQNAGDQSRQDTSNMMAWKNAQNPFLTNQDYQQMQNDPGGYVGNQVKNSIGMASYGVPFGGGGASLFGHAIAPKATGILGKAIIPGMAAGGMQGISDPHASIGSVAADTVMGGALPGLGGALGKMFTKSASPLGKTLTNTGTAFTQSQYNLPEKLADQYNMHDVIQQVFNDTGITSMQKATDLAHELNSAIGNVVTTATGKTPAIDLGGMNAKIGDILSHYYEIPQAQKQDIANVVKGGLGYALDGKTDIANADPTKVLESIRNFEGNAADHWDAYARTSDVSQKQKAQAFANISDAIKDRFYNGRSATETGVTNQGGMNKAIVKYVQENPQVTQQVHAIAQKYGAPSLAIQFDKAIAAGDGQAVRHIMYPYVNIAHANNYAQNVVAKKVISPWEFFGAMSQFGGNPLHALPAWAAYRAANSNAGKSFLGKLLMSAGGKMPSLNTPSSQTANRLNTLSAHALPTLQGGSVQ